MICTHCGANNHEDALYCSQCGQPLTQNTCPSCHHEVSPDALYCQYCGQPLKQRKEAVCPKCHYVNKPGVGYCVQCGSKLAQASTAFQMEYVENEVEVVESKIHWHKVLTVFLSFVFITVVSYIILKTTHGVHVTNIPKHAIVMR